MATRPTDKTSNLTQLEQLAFDAGVKFAYREMAIDIPTINATQFPDSEETEAAMEKWRQLAMVRSLENQVKNG